MTPSVTGPRGSVLVLTSDPAHPTVTADARAAVDAVLGTAAPWRTLAAEVAAEREAPATINLAAVRAALAGQAVDANVVQVQARRKHLLISDMDSTMIEQECIDEMAAVRGIKPRIAAITERAMRGELDFEGALLERLGLLAGMTEADLEAVFRERVTLMPGGRTLVATMRAHGAYTALVSGGFTFFTQRVARALGFDTHRANQLAFADGQLAGGVVGAILGRAAKRQLLGDLAAARGLPLADTLAVGDGANDLDMIRAAGLGVAFRAKPVVAAEAGASITHGDLTALLYLQGYAAADVVTA
jgi:phosphoserine phosphatase